MKIFYFTATGNNLYIAKRIGGELFSIPQVMKEENPEYNDDSIGIVFPCYYFGTPVLVKEFLKKVTLKADYIFAIMSYGNYSFAGVNHFLKLCRIQEIKLSYLNEILMVDNYIPLFEIQEQINTVEKKNIEENLNIIISDINSRKNYVKKENVIKRFFTLIAQKYYKYHLKKADLQFLIEDSCDRCKICEKVCPVNNIIVREKPEYLHHCEECLACTHNCPQNAIRMKNENSKKRYRNKNISIKEIIDSNI
ncbi:MAG: EFR1 family ferrodoxin [Bacillota bacterium]